MKAVQNVGRAGQRLVNSIPPQFINNRIGNLEEGFTINRKAMYEQLIANDLLRRDEAREIDDALIRVADRDRVGISDLQAAGLVRPLRNMGVTLFQVDRHGAVADAEQSMSITALTDRDQVQFTPSVFPVPVTSGQFQLDRRYIAAGETRGMGVDVVNVEEWTRSVIRRLENTLTNGNSAIVLDGNALQGYTNFSARQTASFAGSHWDDLASGDREEIVEDVSNLKSKLTADGYMGPYMLYIPTNFELVMDDDYKAESDRTVRERILAISGIQDVKVLPSLANDNVLLVQMTRSVVEYAVGQELTTVTWDLMGGLAQNWALLEVSTFALKTAEDEDGNATSGIAHMS